MVEAQEPAEALPTYQRSRVVEVGRGHDELAAEALMGALFVVVSQVLARPVFHRFEEARAPCLISRARLLGTARDRALYLICQATVPLQAPEAKQPALTTYLPPAPGGTV